MEAVEDGPKVEIVSYKHKTDLIRKGQDMKNIVKRLAAEYKGMHKPDMKTLIGDTARIGGTAVCAAIVLKLVDTGFASLLELIL